MSQIIVLKKNDRKPPVLAQAVDIDGNIVDLTDAVSVTFKMRIASGTTNKVSSSATIQNAKTGIMMYNWGDGDTDVPGNYNAIFVVNWGSDVPQTFPGKGFMIIQIEDTI